MKQRLKDRKRKKERQVARREAKWCLIDEVELPLGFLEWLCDSYPDLFSFRPTGLYVKEAHVRSMWSFKKEKWKEDARI
jgi:hypothetical protein